MGNQLDAIVRDLESASARLYALRDTLSQDAWTRKPSPVCWSAAECIAHLNLASAAALPFLRDALRDARSQGTGSRSRYRRDLIGWLVWNYMTPAGHLRTTTIPAWEPGNVESRAVEDIVSDFDRLQNEVVACVRESEGLPIDRVKIASPFDPRVQYNLYAALTLLPRHQHRHLRQAECAVRRCQPELSFSV